MKVFIDLVNIMNTLFNRVKEFFNITPGVSNQKGLNYKSSQPAGLPEDAVAGSEVVAKVTEGHFAFNKFSLRKEQSHHTSQIKQMSDQTIQEYWVS